ncbi:hypothetical protein D3C73_867520 [compost metagenome]
MAREIVQPFGNHRKTEDKTVGCTIVEPLDELGRDGIRRTDEPFPWRGGIKRRLPQGLRLLLCHPFDPVRCRAEAVLANVAKLGERRIQIVGAEIVMIEEAAEIGESFLDRDQVADGLVFFLGLGLCAADDRTDARKDLDVIGRATMSNRRLLHT